MPKFETRLEIGELTREGGGLSMWQARRRLHAIRD